VPAVHRDFVAIRLSACRTRGVSRRALDLSLCRGFLTATPDPTVGLQFSIKARECPGDLWSGRGQVRWRTAGTRNRLDQVRCGRAVVRGNNQTRPATTENRCVPIDPPDAKKLLDHWRGGEDEQSFEQWLNQIEALLDRAVRERAWVFLCL
jgi:hypothetical protein